MMIEKPELPLCQLRALDPQTGQEVFIKEGQRSELEAEALERGADYFVWPEATAQ